MVSRRTAIAVLAGVPAAVIAGAWCWLALEHGTPWLADVVVHESGRYTLRETVLYPRHLLRELPVAALYAAASVGAYAAYGPVARRVPSPTVRAMALGTAAALVGAAWWATARELGVAAAAGEVLQAYVRDDEPPAAGAHWAYHVGGCAAYVAAAVVLAALLQRALHGSFRRPSSPERSRWIGGTVVAGVLLSGLCLRDAGWLRDARCVGHQIREAATHLLVTLPLGFALLLGLHGPSAGVSAVAPVRGHARDVLVATTAAVAVAVVLCIAALQTGAAHAGRSGAPLASLLAAHVFEHTLDIVLVLLLVVAATPARPAAEDVA